MSTQVLKGIAASDGIAIAKTYLLTSLDLSFSKKQVANIDGEMDRLNAAISASKEELASVKKRAIKNLGANEAEVFEAHIAILSDPEFIAAVNRQIKTEQINAEAALKDVVDQYVVTFEAMSDNPYMQERISDIRDVTKRVTAQLLGRQLPHPTPFDQDVIVVAHDLTPSDTAQLDKRFVKGFITDLGGRTSHSAIMARTLEIPAVVGTKNATKTIETDQTVIVDGLQGLGLVAPSDGEIKTYLKKQARYRTQRAEWAKLKEAPSITKDGVKHTIAANIGTPDDLQGVLNNGGEAVGLFRSEFLYMNSADWPTEEQQFEAYKSVVTGMQNKPVVVRTMDIGGDKDVAYLKMSGEMNPFMGYRAVRISLNETAIFKTQLRALIRASYYGQLWIMFPMIATIDEFRAAKQIYEEERQTLIQTGTPIGEIKVGMMLEIPAAAVLADQFAKEVDFMSIGTNDLIGYSMAADRTNERVSYLYQPYNPSILRLIKYVIDSCHKEGKFVAMCGEMAGDQIAVPILLGMGLDEFSMSATSMLQTRALFKKLDTVEMAKLATQAINAKTNDEVVDLVKKALPFEAL